jgi:hypothetical protein
VAVDPASFVVPVSSVEQQIVGEQLYKVDFHCDARKVEY